MANPTGAFGLRPVRKVDGSPFNGGTIPCYIASTYAVALFVGDPVLITATTADRDTTGRYPSIAVSAGVDADMIFGVIDSFEPLKTDLSKTYNPASTERIANVIIDQNVIYQIRGDGGGTVDKNMTGANAAMIATASGSTSSGLSGFHLDEGTTTAPQEDQSLPLVILGRADNPGETLADNTLWEVLINNGLNIVGSRVGVLGA